MIRAAARLLLASFFFVGAAAPLTAAEPAESAVKTTAAETSVKTILEPASLTDARWMYDQPRSGQTLNILLGSYGVLQGFDMYSTLMARRNGASELNPLMNTGYAQATAFKAATSTATYFAARAIAKKNRKAAIATMILVNGVTGAVVLNNMKNARR